LVLESNVERARRVGEALDARDIGAIVAYLPPQ
jgi:hypothetical protein